MKMRLLAGMAAFLAVTPVWATEPCDLHLVDFGLYAGNVVQNAGKDATGNDLKELSQRHLLRRTEGIPASKGVEFGIEYVAFSTDSNQKIKLTLELTHPPVTDPKTKQTSSSETWEKEITPGVKFQSGFGFDQDWEVVPGPWTLKITSGCRNTLEKTFAVHKP
ncbi:MAG: DUF3859 domain-containing protein [Magnetococcales bacterium]|nr:DUF3859 domain-containing protein [Magnetococcales bacterium]